MAHSLVPLALPLDLLALLFVVLLALQFHANGRSTSQHAMLQTEGGLQLERGQGSHLLQQLIDVELRTRVGARVRARVGASIACGDCRAIIECGDCCSTNGLRRTFLKS